MRRWWKTAQSSSALRDTRSSITDDVYKILNSYKTIIHINDAMPGDDFVPTLPPRKKATAAAPTANYKPDPVPESKVQPAGPEVE